MTYAQGPHLDRWQNRREDRDTNTVEDAAKFEAAQHETTRIGGQPYDVDDVPSPADLADE